MDAIVAQLGENAPSFKDMDQAKTVEAISQTEEQKREVDSINMLFAQQFNNYFVYNDNYYNKLVAACAKSKEAPEKLIRAYANNSFFAALQPISYILEGLTGKSKVTAEAFKSMVADSLPRVNWQRYRAQADEVMIGFDFKLAAKIRTYSLPELQAFVRSSKHMLIHDTLHILSALLGVQFIIVEFDEYANKFVYKPLDYTGTTRQQYIVIERTRISKAVDRRVDVKLEQLPFYVFMYLALPPNNYPLPVLDRYTLPADVLEFALSPPPYVNPFIQQARKKRKG